MLHCPLRRRKETMLHRPLRQGKDIMLRFAHRRRPRIIIPLGSLPSLLLFVLLMACERPEPEGPRVEARDSAGVTIVENRGEVGPHGGGWRVSAEALLSIGTFQGDSLHQLYQVQGARRLSGGGVAVANAGSGEVRVYDPSGVFVRSLGRRGEGPGEFQRPALAGVLGGDTLVVADMQLRRITLVHPVAGVVGSARVAEDLGGAVLPQGMLADRTVVLGGGFYWSGSSGETLTEGYSRPPTSYRSCSLEGDLVTDFGEFPGSEFNVQIRSVGGGMAMSARLIPFGKYPMQTVSPGFLHVGSGESWEVRSYRPSGELARIVRLDRELRPVRREDLEAYVREAVAEATDPAQAQEIRRGIEALPTPDFMPASASLHADHHGYLWVERYRAPGEEPAVHDVLDPEGRLVGWVSLPAGLQILESGPDYVLGLYRDDLEVEYVRVYALEKPGASEGM
jgi:hypothetical protein